MDGRAVDALIEVEWARYQLGAIPVSELPDLGVRLLQAGAGEVELAELAALPPPPLGSSAACRGRVRRRRTRPRSAVPDRSDAASRPGPLLAAAIADGRLDAATGGGLIDRLLR